MEMEVEVICNVPNKKSTVGELDKGDIFVLSEKKLFWMVTTTVNNGKCLVVRIHDGWTMYMDHTTKVKTVFSKAHIFLEE